MSRSFQSHMDHAQKRRKRESQRKSLRDKSRPNRTNVNIQRLQCLRYQKLAQANNTNNNDKDDVTMVNSHNSNNNNNNKDTINDNRNNQTQKPQLNNGNNTNNNTNDNRNLNTNNNDNNNNNNNTNNKEEQKVNENMILTFEELGCNEIIHQSMVHLIKITRNNFSKTKELERAIDEMERIKQENTNLFAAIRIYTGFCQYLDERPLAISFMAHYYPQIFTKYLLYRRQNPTNPALLPFNDPTSHYTTGQEAEKIFGQYNQEKEEDDKKKREENMDKSIDLCTKVVKMRREHIESLCKIYNINPSLYAELCGRWEYKTKTEFDFTFNSAVDDVMKQFKSMKISPKTKKEMHVGEGMSFDMESYRKLLFVEDDELIPIGFVTSLKGFDDNYEYNLQRIESASNSGIMMENDRVMIESYKRSAAFIEELHNMTISDVKVNSYKDISHGQRMILATVRWGGIGESYWYAKGPKADDLRGAPNDYKSTFHKLAKPEMQESIMGRIVDYGLYETKTPPQPLWFGIFPTEDGSDMICTEIYELGEKIVTTERLKAVATPNKRNIYYYDEDHQYKNRPIAFFKINDKNKLQAINKDLFDVGLTSIWVGSKKRLQMIKSNPVKFEQEMANTKIWAANYEAFISFIRCLPNPGSISPLKAGLLEGYEFTGHYRSILETFIKYLWVKASPI